MKRRIAFYCRVLVCGLYTVRGMADTVLFQNGDLLDAELIQLAGETSVLESSLHSTPLTVPHAAIRSWYHQTDKPSDSVQILDRVQLVSGQELQGQVQSWDDQKLQLVSVWGQTLNLDRASVLWWAPANAETLPGMKAEDWQLGSRFQFEPDTTSEWTFLSGRATHPRPRGHGLSRELKGLPKAFVLHSRIRFQGKPDAYRIKLELFGEKEEKPEWELRVSHGTQQVLVRDRQHLWGDLVQVLPEDIRQQSVQEVWLYVDTEKGLVTLWVNGRKLKQVKARFPAERVEAVRSVRYHLHLNSSKPVVVEQQDVYEDVTPLFEDRGEGEGAFMVLENFDIQPVEIEGFDGKTLNVVLQGISLPLPKERVRKLYFRHPVEPEQEEVSSLMLVQPHPLLSLKDLSLQQGLFRGRLPGVVEEVEIPTDVMHHLSFPATSVEEDQPEGVTTVRLKRDGWFQGRLLESGEETAEIQPVWLDHALSLPWSRLAEVSSGTPATPAKPNAWIRLGNGDVLAATVGSLEKGALSARTQWGERVQIPVESVRRVIQHAPEPKNWVYDLHEIERGLGLAEQNGAGIRRLPEGGTDLPNGLRYFFPLPDDPQPYQVILRVSSKDPHYHAMVGLSTGPKMNTPRVEGVRVILDTRGASVRFGGQIQRVTMSPDQYRAGEFRLEVNPVISSLRIFAGDTKVYDQELTSGPLAGLTPAVTFKKRGNKMTVHEFQVIPEPLPPLPVSWKKTAPLAPFAFDIPSPGAGEAAPEASGTFWLKLQDRFSSVHAEILGLANGNLTVKLVPSGVELNIPVQDVWSLSSLPLEETPFDMGWHSLSLEAEDEDEVHRFPRGR